MKKAILMSAILCFGTATAAIADPVDVSTEAKRSSVMVGSFVTGAFAGGPLGAVAGALAGAWLGDQVEEADQAERLEGQLAEANGQVERLSAKLITAETTTQQFAQIALDQLQLELLFKTNDSQLTASGQKRMAYLADFLVNNPELHIQLDGYADPRGNESYNLALSSQRVQTVAALLMANGVIEDRIVTQSHGASQSSAAVGDYDTYALERVVKIQLTKGKEQSSFAQVTLIK